MIIMFVERRNTGSSGCQQKTVALESRDYSNGKGCDAKVATLVDEVLI